VSLVLGLTKDRLHRLCQCSIFFEEKSDSAAGGLQAGGSAIGDALTVLCDCEKRDVAVMLADLMIRLI
jgi:hypothetical protein